MWSAIAQPTIRREKQSGDSGEVELALCGLDLLQVGDP